MQYEQPSCIETAPQANDKLARAAFVLAQKLSSAVHRSLKTVQVASLLLSLRYSNLRQMFGVASNTKNCCDAGNCFNTLLLQQLLRQS